MDIPQETARHVQPSFVFLFGHDTQKPCIGRDFAAVKFQIRRQSKSSRSPSDSNAPVGEPSTSTPITTCCLFTGFLAAYPGSFARQRNSGYDDLGTAEQWIKARTPSGGSSCRAATPTPTPPVSSFMLRPTTSSHCRSIGRWCRPPVGDRSVGKTVSLADRTKYARIKP